MRVQFNGRTSAFQADCESSILFTRSINFIVMCHEKTVYAVVAEWQTRQLEGLVGAILWRFESSRPHHDEYQDESMKCSQISLEKYNKEYAPIAQLDRAFDYGSKGQGFDSSWARHNMMIMNSKEFFFYAFQTIELILLSLIILYVFILIVEFNFVAERFFYVIVY